MKYFYDLHIHTALSPCADNDMTPQNIVAMANMIGLDIIAISDHNTVGNVNAVIEVVKKSERDLLVVPAMELTTSEDIHILLLFADLESAKGAESEVKKRQTKITNKPKILGEQHYYDAFDNIIGYEENLLIATTDISCNDCSEFAKKYNGIAIPAHANKDANSIISTLGAIEHYMGFRTIELTEFATDELRFSLKNKGYNIITDSDSHMLGILNDREEKNSVELDKFSIKALLAKFLKN